MKILITGKDSYIGTSFEKWIEQYDDAYIVDAIDVRDDNWKQQSFVGYDAILHVAGIAHINAKKIDDSLYYKVNRDLAVDLAVKAKQDGVKQFVFLSSMSVYGIEQGVITKDTIPTPKSSYGKSKLEAEQRLNELVDNAFKVSMIRPPMVYGKGCKGNYIYLDKLTNLVSVFPKVQNKRSMIHIDVLSEFIKVVIDNQIAGTLYPQNKEYICTSDMVKRMAQHKGKRLILVPGFDRVFKMTAKKVDLVCKVFGDLLYEENISKVGYDYQTISFDESIKRSL